MPAQPCVLLHDVVYSNGTLWMAGGQTSTGASFKLTTRYMSSEKRIRLQHTSPLPQCKQRRSYAVLAAVPGDFGCKQVAHFLYNFVLPQWHALKNIGWLNKSAHLYLDCTGTQNRGMPLANAPTFVAEATRVLGVASLQPLSLAEGTRIPIGAADGYAAEKNSAAYLNLYRSVCR